MPGDLLVLLKAILTVGSIALVVLRLTPAAQAQPADTTIAEAAELARFEEARALAVDPSGTLYVADAGADVVVRLSPEGEVLDRLGGAGSAEGQFDNPADLDPTNGLVLIVADAGNGRLQRFSRRFRFLEALPVGGKGAEAARPIYDAGGTDPRGSGRPIAVVSTSADETFAIDAEEGVVFRWTADRRAQEVIGGFGEGEAALVEPVALALASEENLLFVADRGREAILVYDTFGGFVGLFPGEAFRDVQALMVHEGQLWAVLPEELLVYDLQGRRLRTLGVRLGEPLVDVARKDDRLYLLTATRLYRTTP